MPKPIRVASQYGWDADFPQSAGESPTAVSCEDLVACSWESNFHDAALRLNFNKGVEFSFAAPLTDAAGFFPIFGRSKIRIPKGPGSTLPWPRLVDRTFSSVGVEQQAVTVRKFLEASTNAHLADIEFFKLVNILDSHGLGQLIDFLLIHPDVARCSGTAVTASGTCKIQTFVIPGLFGQDSVP